jgi:hypothetical protein
MLGLIVGISLIILSGGGTNDFSLIFILIFTGGYLLFFPSRHLPGKGIVRVISALLAWVLISTWVPMPFPCATSWLKHIDPALVSSSSVSAQPILSSEKAVYLICGLAWLFLVLDKPLNHYYRVKCMVFLTWTLSALGLIALLGVVLHFQHPFTWGTHRFSFFPNHNQNGAVLAMSGILAMGMIIRTTKKRDWRVVLFMACFGILTFSITMGMSRSAVIILAVGCLLGVFLALEEKNFRFYLKLGVPFFLILIAVFIMYSGNLLNEFLLLVKSGGVKEEFRVWIYYDAFRLIAHFPIFGVGLGNFRYFFPLIQENVDTLQSIYHPESDLLWLWSELGILGVGIVTTGIVLLFKRLDPIDIVKTKGSRLVGLLVFGLFIFAGLFEVSGHRLGTCLLAIVFYGLSQPETATLNRSRVLPILCRVCAVAMLLLATVWIQMKVDKQPFTSDDMKEYAALPVKEIIAGREINDVINEVDKRLARYPLMHQLYILRGRLAINADRAIPEIDTDFKRSQFLMPIRWQPFIYHGIFVHSIDFDLAMSYWEKGIGIAKQDKRDAFLLITRYISADLYSRLRDLVYTYPSLKYTYFVGMNSNPKGFSRELSLELAMNPELEGLSLLQKKTLLWKYTEINGHAALKRLVERHPVLADENWTVRAQVEAGSENYEEACRLAILNYPEFDMIDLTGGRTLNIIRTEYLLDPDDPLKVIAMIQKQESNGFYKDELITIEVAFRKGIRNEFLDYKLARLYFNLGNYEESWIRFNRIISKSITWD